MLETHIKQNQSLKILLIVLHLKLLRFPKTNNQIVLIDQKNAFPKLILFPFLELDPNLVAVIILKSNFINIVYLIAHLLKLVIELLMEVLKQLLAILNIVSLKKVDHYS